MSNLCHIISVNTKQTDKSLQFFSIRRRHTRCGRDWSSDVCSSDLFIDFFIITDSLGNNVPVTLSMLDYSSINLDEVGTYTLSISYKGNFLDLELTVIDNTPPVTYTIKVNDSLSTNILKGSQVNFIDFFIITDSLGNNVPVTLSMLDYSSINLDEVGTYTLSISYEGNFLDLELTVIDNAPPVT